MTATVSEELLQLLADGRFHSGQQLAQYLGVSRTAVWKQVKRLESDYGLAMHAVRGRGYRLAAPLDLLSLSQIRDHLSAETLAQLDKIVILTCTPSTNASASADLPDKSGSGRVWLAEHQTAGRGRRGRDWISAFGANIYLSLAWRFDMPMSQLSALSLAAGVATAESLHDLGVHGHTLKWPNDLLVDGLKLAGILVEVSGEAGGPATAVIGIGINVRMPAAPGARIDQPWTDLASVVHEPISRNALAGNLIRRLVEVCSAFAAAGIAPLLKRWQTFDKLLGRQVRLHSGDTCIEGLYVGIAETGALILENDSGRTEHHAGEVSLRPGGRH